MGKQLKFGPTSKGDVFHMMKAMIKSDWKTEDAEKLSGTFDAICSFYVNGNPEAPIHAMKNPQLCSIFAFLEEDMEKNEKIVSLYNETLISWLKIILSAPEEHQSEIHWISLYEYANEKSPEKRLQALVRLGQSIFDPEETRKLTIGDIREFMPHMLNDYNKAIYLCSLFSLKDSLKVVVRFDEAFLCMMKIFFDNEVGLHPTGKRVLTVIDRELNRGWNSMNFNKDRVELAIAELQAVPRKLDNALYYFAMMLRYPIDIQTIYDEDIYCKQYIYGRGVSADIVLSEDQLRACGFTRKFDQRVSTSMVYKQIAPILMSEVRNKLLSLMKNPDALHEKVEELERHMTDFDIDQVVEKYGKPNSDTLGKNKP